MARGTVYSAVDGPRGDHLQCYGWSGGTDFGGEHLWYDSTPYVGMVPKKMAATLKVHK